MGCDLLPIPKSCFGLGKKVNFNSSLLIFGTEMYLKTTTGSWPSCAIQQLFQEGVVGGHVHNRDKRPSDLRQL